MSSPFLTNQPLAGLSDSMRIRQPIFWRPDQGKVEERSANTPFPVDNPDEVFFVEAGSIDVFSVPPMPGDGAAGPRRYLWTVSQGEALFGLEPATGHAHHTVAVAAPGTRLRRLAFRDVQTRAEAEDWVFTRLIDGFVKRLAGAMVSRPELDVVLTEGTATGVPLGKMAGPIGDLVWVRHTSGSSRFGGAAELPVGPYDPPLPLCKGLWLEAATEDVQLDVFDTQREIQVCVGYRYKGSPVREMPPTAEQLTAVEPVYRTLPGWESSTYGIRDAASLPQAARNYLKFISDDLGCEIGMISTGPERDATIVPPGTKLASWL